MAVAEPRQALVDAAARWACGLVGATDVVDAMTQALVAGIDSPDLAFLAGATRADAENEVAEHLTAAMEDVGLPYFGPGDPRTSLLAAELDDAFDTITFTERTEQEVELERQVLEAARRIIDGWHAR